MQTDNDACDQIKIELKRRSDIIYKAVKDHDPSLYKQIVEIGNLASDQFIPDNNKRMAVVESAIMSLVATLIFPEGLGFSW